MPSKKQPDPAVYRCFGADGVLLYVGRSLGVSQRLESHKIYSSWFPFVETIKIQRFSTSGEADAAERLAISSELPKHNRVLLRTPPAFKPILVDGEPVMYDINIMADAAGGVAELVKAMGLHERKGYNSVAMWRHRGSIPAAAILKHQVLFDKLMKKPSGGSAK